MKQNNPPTASRLNHLQLILPKRFSGCFLTDPISLLYYFHLSHLPNPGDYYAFVPRTGSATLLHSPLIVLPPPHPSSNFSYHSFASAKKLNQLLTQLLLPHSLVAVDDTFSLKASQNLGSLTAKTTFIPSSTIIAFPRLIKSTAEITTLKTAVLITSKTMSWALAQLKPGVTEIDLAHQIILKLLKLGADNPAFEPIVAFGPNTAHPHHFPSHRRLQPNDIVLLDLGAKYHHYHADMTRTRLPRQTSDLMKRVKTIVHHAFNQALGSLHLIDTPYSYIDTAARSIINQAGFKSNFIHSTGHGLGLNIHEAPHIYAKSTDTIKSGQVVTLEPGIYLPGKFGYRHEDTILITSKTPQVLTQVFENE